MATATIERRPGRPAHITSDGGVLSIIVSGNEFRFRVSSDGSIRAAGVATEELRMTAPADFAYAKARVRGLV